MWNTHRMFIMHRNLKTLETLEESLLVKVRNFYFPFLSLRFLDMRRNRQNFFLSWLFHLSPPRAAPPPQTTVLASASSENQLTRLEFKSQLTVFFFSNSQILSASGHDVNHVPGPISYLDFLLWHFWLSHPPRTRVNTCTQCVHLTNPYTKQRVLNLTKPKGKIYKTKSLRNFITYGLNNQRRLTGVSSWCNG